MKLNLLVADLKAALNIAPKSDTRYYLNGVLIDLVNRRELLVVATDGHMLLALKREIAESDSVQPGTQLIIPRETLELALKAVSKSKDVYLVLESLGDKYTLGSQVFQPVDGRFPEYVRVIPQAVSGQAAIYNPELLTRLEKSFAALGTGAKEYALYQNGGDAAVVLTPDENVIAVVMPWRNSPKLRQYTGWVHAAPEQAQAA